jgi:hypothetical protein
MIKLSVATVAGSRVTVEDPPEAQGVWVSSITVCLLDEDGKVVSEPRMVPMEIMDGALANILDIEFKEFTEYFTLTHFELYRSGVKWYRGELDRHYVICPGDTPKFRIGHLRMEMT